MKKVLIIGYLWPYIKGSKRTIGIAKYLADFGWEPIVLTSSIEHIPKQKFRIIKTNYRYFLGSWIKIFGFHNNIDMGTNFQAKIKKAPLSIISFLRFFYKILVEIKAYPDTEKNWKSLAIKECHELFRSEKIDAVISIVYPTTSHIIANELKIKYKIPWIADFADLWSNNAAYSHGRIRKYFDKKLEIRTLSSANILTTSSMPLVEKLKLFHKGKKVFLIPFGFDPEMINYPSAKIIKKFSIIYTGIFYPNKRDPSKFFLALSQLLSEGRIDINDIEVNFYSPVTKEMNKKIQNYKLKEVVKQYEMIPFEECINKQRESQLLLHLNWEDEKEKGIFSGKFFDYLAAGRPILAAGGVGKDETVKEILKKTKAGVYCSKVEEIKQSLVNFYSEFKKNGVVSYHGVWIEINRHSNREMARKFADALDKITKK